MKGRGIDNMPNTSKKYEVRITETLIYEMEVEATSREEAEKIAYDSEQFRHNQSNDIDSIAEVREIVEFD